MKDFVEVEVVSEGVQTFVGIMFISEIPMYLKLVLLRVRNETFDLVVLRVFYPSSPNILNRFGGVVSGLERELRVEIFLIQAYDNIFAKCSFLLRVINNELVVARRQKCCIAVNIFILDVAV